MVKRLFIIFGLVSLLNANELMQQIESIIGHKNYQIQKKLIKIIFKNENLYYKNGRVDIVKVAKKLKKEGLLNIYLKSPQNMEITFTTTGNPLLFLKNVRDSLRDTGYGFFTTKRAKRIGENFEWVISLKSESLIDPEIFGKELSKRGILINKIQRVNLYQWEYELDNSQAQVISRQVKSSDTLTLKKPLEDYWLNLIDSPSHIEIKSNPHDIWHPYIVFYDPYLRIVGKFIQNSKMKEVKLEIPPSTKYIKISDFYSLSNIKRGLNIHLYP